MLQMSTAVRNNTLDAAVYGPVLAESSTITAWLATTTYTALTSWVINSGNVYLCTTSGTSAGSGGPTTTSSNITDGTAHWTYIGRQGIGPAPTLNIYNGTIPANCGTALSGNTLLATGTLPAGWMAAASSGADALAGTWTLTGQSGAGAGTNGTFFRLLDAAGTCHYQGSLGPTGGTTQTATWSASSTAVTLSGSNSLIVAGMAVTGPGIQAGTTVSAISGTSLTLSQNALVLGSGATLTFTGDMAANNTSIANAQSVSVTAFTLTAGNA